MSSVRYLHDKAMHLAQLAMIARHRGNYEEAEALARQACKLESDAAELVPYGVESEPTRSILYRSAASLAYQSKEFKIAQQLIAKGLSGFPTPQVEQELKDLYEQVNFEYHLQVRGATLEYEDFQLVLQGSVVGFGIIVYDEFIKRLKTTRSLIDRTVQRLMGRTYQKSGRISSIYRPFIPAISVPREGSFAVTIKLAKIEGTRQLPLFVTAVEVIEQILTGVELVNDSDFDGLYKLIGDDLYYRNFIVATKDLAPDGKNINFVGFTSTNKAVSLIQQRDNIKIPLGMDSDEEREREPIEVVGEMDYAVSRRQKNLIGLTTENGKQFKIHVEEGMEDLVRSYFGEWVTVTGMWDGELIYPSDIRVSNE